MAGARVDRLPTDGAEGRLALRVAFEDRRVPFSHVRQRLALPPGRYRLSGRAKPDGLRTERGRAPPCRPDRSGVFRQSCSSRDAPITGGLPARTGCPG